MTPLMSVCLAVGESMIGGSSRLRATVFDPNDEGKEEVSPPERAEPRRVLPPPPPVIPQATPTPLPRYAGNAKPTDMSHIFG